MKILYCKKNAYICKSKALSDARRLCEKPGKHNIKLEIASINEFDECQDKKMQTTELFIIFETEFVNETTGQVVNLTTTCGSYRELGKYLTEMERKSWKMLKVKRKET